VGAACVWAPWIDERFVLAAPFAFLCRFLWRTRKRESEVSTALNWRREALLPSLLLIIFVLIRLIVLAPRTSAGATVAGYFSGRHFWDAPVARIALGVWEGLRAGWFLLVAGLILLRARPERALALAAGTAVLATIGLATAQDYSRSMTMLLPGAMLGALFVAEARPNWPPWLRFAAVAIALLVPAHHVMNDRVNPIFSLHHEIAALDNPPAIAMPELYELRAIHEMERGETEQAEADLTLAIKLSTNPSSPLKQLGILAASHGRWTDAFKDFSTWLEYEPQNPDAWFMRAQANLATGNSAAAQADFEKAKSLAPAHWSDRPDVNRFIANLKRSAAPR